jgi:hypothetical protein
MQLLLGNGPETNCLQHPLFSRDEMPETDFPVAIEEQSICAGVATNLAAEQHLFRQRLALSQNLNSQNPFISIQAMLEMLYLKNGFILAIYGIFMESS